MIMRRSIAQDTRRIQATKKRAAQERRRRLLLDDHTGQRDEHNFWALDWSLGVTFGVLSASAAQESVRDLHARLFPCGWPGLRNLYDGWRDRMFVPLTYTELNPTGIAHHDDDGRVILTQPPSGRLPPTMQLGALLEWDWPIHEPAGVAVSKLAESFRQRHVDSKGNPAQMWHNRRSRNAHAVRELERRINAEGVGVEWSDTPMAEPCFRSMATRR